MFEIEKIVTNLTEEISQELNKVGILFHIFSRLKSQGSINEKLERDAYLEGKKIQDFIGIRITLYFSDDIPSIVNFFRTKYRLDNKDIDFHNETTFKPQRLNLVLRLEGEGREVFDEIVSRRNPKIDSTFEVQIRTVLSDGWHEVEHDLRYKCKKDWVMHKDLSRALNGVYATLETGEWTMMSIFTDLGYRNYKQKNWEGMLRNKFRLRFQQNPLNQKIINFFNNNNEIAKHIFKLNRTKLLERLFCSQIAIPITFDNIVYILNHIYFKNEYIYSLQSDFIRAEIENNLDMHKKMPSMQK